MSDTNEGMRTAVTPRLLWKLLAINVVVIALVMLIIYLAIEYRAAAYFMTLMEMYDIAPTTAHELFLEAVYRAFGWASLVSLSVAALFSYLLTRAVLRPLAQMSDYTARIAAGDYEARIRVASNDEIARLGHSFNTMAERLKQVQELRKTMVIDVAHELRTPLTNVQGYLEALRDKVIPADPATIQSLYDETCRLARLVEDILTLARSDATRVGLRREAVNFTPLLLDVARSFVPELSAKGVRLVTKDCCLEGVLDVDPERIKQVCRNLLENAARYTPDGGQVSIHAKAVEGDAVRVTVANTGEAIGVRDLPFLFERFYRAEKSRSRASGGAGIGLAIAKELVLAHGGRVGADSSNGETRVWFDLPAPR